MPHGQPLSIRHPSPTIQLPHLAAIPISAAGQRCSCRSLVWCPMMILYALPFHPLAKHLRATPERPQHLHYLIPDTICCGASTRPPHPPQPTQSLPHILLSKVAFSPSSSTHLGLSHLAWWPPSDDHMWTFTWQLNSCWLFCWLAPCKVISSN